MQAIATYKHLILCIILLTVCDSAYSQTLYNHKKNIQCGTQDLYEYHQSETENKKIENAEKKYSRGLEIVDVRNESIVLPIVIHIIHNNGTENISDAQILQGLDDLNHSFGNEGYYYNEESVDTDIQFCLAQRDESNEATTGIIRHTSAYTNMELDGAWSQIKSIANWDKEKYINIRIVANACLQNNCSIAGFGGLGSGLVVESQYWGIVPKYSTVITHEMGHTLGLRHTFNGGCKNDNCLTDGDKVCDTPPDNSTFDFCSLGTNSCYTDTDDSTSNNPYRDSSLGGLGDQDDFSSNYMDYNISSCRTQYTQGQADRMHFFIDDYYADMANSKSCYPPCPDLITGAFVGLLSTAEVSSALSLTNSSTGATDYIWRINDLEYSHDADLQITFTEVGTYEITLAAYNNNPACDTIYYTQSIDIVCNTNADIQYDITGNELTFSSISNNQDSQSWELYDGEGSLLYTSMSGTDSYNVSGMNFIQLCLAVQNTYCQDQQCEYITLSTNGAEVCNNEVDDDGDGLVDLFDPDCPCNVLTYQAQCEPDCEIIPDSFPDFEMKLKWQSEVISNYVASRNIVVGDLNSDGLLEIVTIKNDHDSFGSLSGMSYLLTINAFDGTTLNKNIISDEQTIRIGIAIANINNDQNSEIFINQYNYINVYNQDHTLKTVSEELNWFNPHPIQLADLNGDGVPEIIHRTRILNPETGKILYEGPLGGCNSNLFAPFIDCFFTNTVVADLLPTPGLELAAGNTVYDIELNNTNGTSGNVITTITADPPVTDGLTSVGDIDGDGALDVIVVQSQDNDSGGGIWVWNPRSSELIAHAPAGQHGGVAMIGDVDGDCLPEIAMTFENELRMYKYNGTSELQLLYNITTTDDSGRTGITMFDFNQDGSNELIYRDETTLRIIEGSTGAILKSTPMLSLTGHEYPIIADVDHDGQAEILVTGNLDGNGDRIFCFESASTPWAPARSVWNQYGYNPTFVNDDLTIPREPQHMATPLQGTENCEQETCSTPYNNFMVQATYRTQEGCLVWPSLDQDLSITALGTCVGDSVEICLYATASDTTIIREGVRVTCWTEPPLPNDEPLDQNTITEDTTCMMVYLPDGIESIIIAINNEGIEYPPIYPSSSDIPECDYSNNEYLLDILSPDYIIEDIYYECTPDSLIYYLIIDNVGAASTDSCVSVVCRIFPADNPEGVPLEVTSWCFDIDEDTDEYIYYDTIRVATPMPTGITNMYWAINDIGQGPGINTNYECDINNNEYAIDIDLAAGPPLDLGPDIIKCQSEVITLNASDQYYTYLWSDLTTDSIFSTSLEGVHSVTVTDLCGGSQTDSIRITIDPVDDVQLPNDTIICANESLSITIADIYDEIHWLPATAVDCDTCAAVTLSDTVSEIIVIARLLDCISADTMQIDYRDIDTTYITDIICEGDSSLFAGNWLTVADTYLDTLNNGFGCDSIVQLDLTVVETLMSMDSMTICSGDSTLWNDAWLYTEGIYSDTTSSVSGCDSIAQLSIITLPVMETVDTLPLCVGDTIILWDLAITTGGDYDTLFQSVVGCDSLISYHMYEIPNVMTYDTVDYCMGDTVEILGFTLFDTDKVSQTSLSFSGCDSTHNVYAQFYPTYEVYDTINICNGDTLIIWDIEVTEPSDVEETFATEQGCDSTVYLHVIVDDVIDIQIEEYICEGDSVEIYGQWYDEATSTEIFLEGDQSCDSIIELSIMLWNTFTYNDTLYLCEGDSLMVGDTSINTAAAFNRQYNTVNGCDSTIRYEVIALKDTLVMTDYILCPEDSIMIDGQYYYQDTIVEKYHVGINGCDSIHRSTIDLLSTLEPSMSVDCATDQVQLQIDVNEGWNILWSNGDTTSSTYYVNAGEESVNISNGNCMEEYYFKIPEIPFIDFAAELIDTSITFGESISLDLGIDDDVWNITWAPEDIVDCVTCSIVNITPVTTQASVTLEVTDSLGCIYFGQFDLSIKIDNDINVPNIFSPNQDGINDDWTIIADDGILLSKCYIYDRWGNLVKQMSQSSDFSWDGYHRGQPAITGVYVYYLQYIDAQGKDKEMAGDLTLIR